MWNKGKYTWMLVLFGHSVMSNSLKPHKLKPSRLLCPWGFPRQAHWSGLPFPSPDDLTHPGIDLTHPGIEPVSRPLAGRFFTAELPGKPKISSKLGLYKDCDQTWGF